MTTRTLRADCSQCAALCCVVPAFTRSADFAIDKPAGVPCVNLADDHRCQIHGQLRTSGFGGCAGFDCHGAGQQLVQVVFRGRDRRDVGTTTALAAAFPVARDAHELLAYLDQAVRLDSARVDPVVDPADLDPADQADQAAVSALIEVIEDRTARDPAALLDWDFAALRHEANAVLTRISDRIRSARPGPKAQLRGADLIGAELAHADLRAANLRGARLVGADLRHGRLDAADLTGADLRRTDVRGTDLSSVLFLLESQVGLARGDASTRLPVGWVRPQHWPTS